MSAHWIALLAATVFEIGWVSLFKVASFERPTVLAVAVLAMVLSFGSLWFALRSIPIGTAYPIWTGIGAAGAMAVGALAYGEPLSVWRAACAGLIVLGVIGLKVSLS